MGHSRTLSNYFSSKTYTIKIVDFGGIWTRIVREEGEQADHLSIATAQKYIILSICKQLVICAYFKSHPDHTAALSKKCENRISFRAKLTQLKF